MSEWLFQTEAYLRQFQATVTSVKDNRMTLDRTAFYPGGGGQPCDVGVVSNDDASNQNWMVVKVQKEGDEIWHEVDGDPPVVGTVVSGRLDWERRRALMRTHTALHILCGVVWCDYEADVTGGNMEPLKARMDFEIENMRRELVEEIEDKVNDEIQKARAVQVRILPREEAFAIPDLVRTKINLLPKGIQKVRVVNIVGLDLQADGGTHVANMCEVGRLRVVKYKSKGKINKRLEVVVE